jgi:hypothetical protein
MSVEIGRTLEVMKEFGLRGLAGANLPPASEMVKDPAFFALLKNEEIREFALYIGGVKLKDFVRGLLPGGG